MMQNEEMTTWKEKASAAYILMIVRIVRFLIILWMHGKRKPPNAARRTNDR